MISSHLILLRRTSRWVPLLWGLTAGCDFPFNSSKYRVGDDEADGEADGGPAGAAGADTPAGATNSISPTLQTLVDAFAGADEQCASAFVASCTAALTDCATSEGCLAYAPCVRSRATPAAETTCADELGTSMDDHWLFELARHCWAGNYAHCPAIGTDFSCVGAYGPPSAERTEVSLRQQIGLVGAPVADIFTVRFCPKFGDSGCEHPAATATTELNSATYEVTLQVGLPNSGIGHDWVGWRVMEGSWIYPSIVESNLPLWGQTVEITRLLPKSFIDAASEKYSSDAKNSVFVQAVDCQSAPAANITFEIPTSPAALVGYVDAQGNPVERTVSTGAGAIYQHELDTLHTILAKKDDLVIAQWSGTLTGGLPRYLRLYPSAAQ